MTTDFTSIRVAARVPKNLAITELVGSVLGRIQTNEIIVSHIFQLDLETAHNVAMTNHDYPLIGAFSGEMFDETRLESETHRGKRLSATSRISQEWVEFVLSHFQFKQLFLFIVRYIIHQGMIAFAKLKFIPPLRIGQIKKNRSFLGTHIIRDIKPIQRHGNIFTQPYPGHFGLCYSPIGQTKSPTVALTKFRRKKAIITILAGMIGNIAFRLSMPYQNEVNW